MGKLKSMLTALLLFLTPLIVFDYTYENFEFPKVYFVYIIGTLLTACLIFEILVRKKPLILPDKYFWFYLSAVLLSVIFSKFTDTSLWGYYTRFNGGFVYTLIFFFILVVFINWKPDRRKIFDLLLFTLLPISLYSIHEHFMGEVRVGSTFGQPNWLAAYISMLMPVLLLSAFGKGRRGWIYSGIFILSFSALWFTYSLSGILSWVAGIGTMIALNRSLIAQNKRRILLLFGFSVLIAVTNLGIFSERIGDVYRDLKKVAVMSFTAYADEGNNISDTGFIRSGMWEGTVNLIFSEPKILLIGTGPETFPYVFPKFRPNSLNYSSEWDFILNKPHNYYLQTAAETGLLGLAAYLVLIVFLIKKKDPEIAPALVSFAVSNFFGWPTAALSVVFWVLASYMNSDSRVLNFKFGKKQTILLLFLLFGVVLFVLRTFSARFYADVLFKQGVLGLNRSDLEGSITNLNSAIKQNPREAIYYRWRAKSYISAVPSSEKDAAKFLKNLALSDLQKAYNLNPSNLATLRNSVPLYYLLSIRDYNEPGSVLNVDFEFVPYANDYFEKLAETAPNDVGVYVLLAKYQNRLGITGGLNRSLEKIQELRPDLLEWHEDLIDLDVSL